MSANVKKLMMAGNAMPTDDKQNAPINEINDSKFGIAMAKKTVKLKKILISFFCQKNIYNFFKCMVIQ